jgi:hypothetical protein
MTQQIEQIWATLLKVGAVQGTAPAETGTPASPWYLKVLSAFFGWLAALFLLGFIGMGFRFVFRSGSAALILGGMMIGGAFAILRIPKNEFVEHLGLAASLAGQALVVFAIFDMSNYNENIAWLLVALLEIPLAVIMPNFVHRVFSSFFAAFAFSMALTSMGWPYIVSGVVMLLAALCWLNEFSYPQHMKKIRAIGYGLVLALNQLKGTALFGFSAMVWGFSPHPSASWIKPWIGEGLIGAVALFVVWHLLRRYHQVISDRLSITALLGTLLLCAVSIKAQGVTVGVVIILFRPRYSLSPTTQQMPTRCLF